MAGVRANAAIIGGAIIADAGISSSSISASMAARQSWHQNIKRQYRGCFCARAAYGAHGGGSVSGRRKWQWPQHR